MAQNFVEAFQEFSENEDLDTECQSKDEDNANEIEIHCLSDILDISRDGDDISEIVLPPHYRCGSNSLNQVAFKDSEAALANGLYKKVIKSAFFKCGKLWRKQNKSSQSADQIKEVLGYYLETPNLTRWNSTFDASEQIVKIVEQKNGIEKLNRCFDACGLQRFISQEIQFLREYCKVMSPLARSLVILQGDKAMYLGFLLPVIVTLQNKLEKSVKEAKKQPMGDGKETSESFFNFSKSQDLQGCQDLLDYMSTKSESLSVLELFLNLRKLFIRYNTTLASSASVKRLFSVAGLIMTPRRCKMSDQPFEKQLFLKV